MSFFLYLILFLLILFPAKVSSAVLEASQLWFMTLLPVLYPSLICLDLISITPLTQKISSLLFPIFKKLFAVEDKNSCYLILLSVLCGAPASTKLIQQAIEQKQISVEEGKRLICVFSNLSLPFCSIICRAFGYSFLLYYLVFFLSAVLFLHFGKKNKSTFGKSIPSKENYLSCFMRSIPKNTTIVLNILGILIVFRVLIGLFFDASFLFYPYLEILGGFSQKPSPVIFYSALNFLGFSIHLQIYSIYSAISYRDFLFARLFFTLTGLILGFCY